MAARAGRGGGAARSCLGFMGRWHLLRVPWGCGAVDPPGAASAEVPTRRETCECHRPRGGVCTVHAHPALPVLHATAVTVLHTRERGSLARRVCAHTSVCVRASVCASTCAHLCARPSVSVCKRVRVHLCISTCVRLRACVHPCVYASLRAPACV